MKTAFQVVPIHQSIWLNVVYEDGSVCSFPVAASIVDVEGLSDNGMLVVGTCGDLEKLVDLTEVQAEYFDYPKPVAHNISSECLAPFKFHAGMTTRELTNKAKELREKAKA